MEGDTGETEGKSGKGKTAIAARNGHQASPRIPNTSECDL